MVRPIFTLPTRGSKLKAMFGNSFCFLFLKTCFWKYEEKTSFLYIWNKKTCLVSWNLKDSFLKKKIKNTKISCY